MATSARGDFTGNNAVKLIKSGREYFDLLLSLIGKATYQVHLQTYIFEADDTGAEVAKALMAASGRGADVYVLLDGYASQSLPSAFIEDLTKSGVRFRWFSPLLKSKYFYFGRRLHHKVLVVDGQIALVGGINIGDRYNDTITATAWLDWALHVEGEVCAQLKVICESRMKEVLLKGKTAALPAVSQLPIYKSKCLVRIRVNDWVKRKKEITGCYLQMLGQAKKHVIIMSPYFLPGRKFSRALRNASARGVRIQLILSGVSDVVIAKYAERYVYRWFFRKNIELYEYRKNVLHGKMSVCDHENVTIGSYNVNNISAYASIELNLHLHDEEFSKRVHAVLSEIIQHDCTMVTAEEYTQKWHWMNGLLQWGAYSTIRLLFYLFTFYYKQRD